MIRRGLAGTALGLVVGLVLGFWASAAANRGAGLFSQAGVEPHQYLLVYLLWGVVVFGVGGVLLPYLSKPVAGFAFSGVSMMSLATAIALAFSSSTIEIVFIAASAFLGGGWAGLRELPKWTAD